MRESNQRAAPVRVCPRWCGVRSTSRTSGSQLPILQCSIWPAFTCMAKCLWRSRSSPSAEASCGAHYRLSAAGRCFRGSSRHGPSGTRGFDVQNAVPNGQTRGYGLPYRRRIKPGSILVREWNGHLQRVTALEDSFAWEGKTYRSLSMVARAITGGHWNGPRFFGLTGSKAMVGAAAAIAPVDQAQTSRIDRGRRAAP
jgi:Protein of unknown function (DUF2924)